METAQIEKSYEYQNLKNDATFFQRLKINKFIKKVYEVKLKNTTLNKEKYKLYARLSKQNNYENSLEAMSKIISKQIQMVSTLDSKFIKTIDNYRNSNQNNRNMDVLYLNEKIKEVYQQIRLFFNDLLQILKQQTQHIESNNLDNLKLYLKTEIEQYKKGKKIQKELADVFKHLNQEIMPHVLNFHWTVKTMAIVGFAGICFLTNDESVFNLNTGLNLIALFVVKAGIRDVLNIKQINNMIKMLEV